MTIWENSTSVSLKKKKKNTNELGPAWHIAEHHCIREQKKIAFSYSAGE